MWSPLSVLTSKTSNESKYKSSSRSNAKASSTSNPRIKAFTKSAAFCKLEMSPVSLLVLISTFLVVVLNLIWKIRKMLRIVINALINSCSTWPYLKLKMFNYRWKYLLPVFSQWSISIGRYRNFSHLICGGLVTFCLGNRRSRRGGIVDVHFWSFKESQNFKFTSLNSSVQCETLGLTVSF